MASYTDFAALLANRKDELIDLEQEEYLQLGNHHITKLLSELATKFETVPLGHLYLYCHRLTGTLSAAGELEIKVHEKGCALRTLDVFTAELQSFSRLVLVGTGRQSSIYLRLYFEINFGPESFWINRADSKDSGPFHALRSQDACLNRHVVPCKGVPHFDLSAGAPAGFQLSAHGSTGVVNNIEPITIVVWDELRPLRATEFEVVGGDARRLQNLPRLLDSLFASAGEELMNSQPSVPRVMAKLRFIRRQTQVAANYVGLVNEVDTLYSRLELPKGFPAPRGTESKDWFFVPEQLPQTLVTGMDVTVVTLIAAAKKLESKDEMQSLRNLIRDTSGKLMSEMQLSVGSSIHQAALDDAVLQAAARTVAVAAKRAK